MITDLKGHFVARHANALAKAQQLAEQAALTEAQLVIIRRQAAEAAGELREATAALGLVDQALEAAGKGVSGAS